VSSEVTSKNLLRCTSKAVIVDPRRYLDKVKCKWFNKIKDCK